jgi:hypothetical protein
LAFAAVPLVVDPSLLQPLRFSAPNSAQPNATNIQTLISTSDGALYYGARTSVSARQSSA